MIATAQELKMSVFKLSTEELFQFFLIPIPIN